MDIICILACLIAALGAINVALKTYNADYDIVKKGLAYPKVAEKVGDLEKAYTYTSYAIGIAGLIVLFRCSFRNYC